MKSTWAMAERAPEEFVSALGDVPKLSAQLLWARGIRDAASAEGFLHPTLGDLHDPALFADMQKAVTRIFRAIAQKEKIAIWGDYDCDGVCGTAILYDALTALGHGAFLNVHMPDRNKEGYGLTMEHLEELRGLGVTCIITVDCGVTDVSEIAWAAERGIDVIIADHHSVPPSLPNAFAILNPKDPRSGYPFAGLAGTGVAFKFAQALLAAKDVPQPAMGYLDIVAIATLADSMPLRDENRALVREGMKRLAETERAGLKALLEFCGIAERFSTRDILFSLVPRLNAMGRLPRTHASLSFRLLTASDPDEIATLLRQLDDANRERQLMTQVIVDEVLVKVRAEKENPPMVFMEVAHYAPGILGLAAQKVMQEARRPVVLTVRKPDSDHVMGNARAVGDFSIVGVLRSRPELFLDAGGHPHAAGFTTTVERLPAVKELFLRAAKDAETKGGFNGEDGMTVDGELSLQDVADGTFRDVQLLGPFGEENPEPQFLFRGVSVEDARAVGESGGHLKLRLALGGAKKKIGAIAFGFGAQTAAVRAAGTIDLVAKLSENIWNGSRAIELQVVDIGIA